MALFFRARPPNGGRPLQGRASLVRTFHSCEKAEAVSGSKGCKETPFFASSRTWCRQRCRRCRCCCRCPRRRRLWAQGCPCPPSMGPYPCRDSEAPAARKQGINKTQRIAKAQSFRLAGSDQEANRSEPDSTKDVRRNAPGRVATGLCCPP